MERERYHHPKRGRKETTTRRRGTRHHHPKEREEENNIRPTQSFLYFKNFSFGTKATGKGWRTQPHKRGWWCFSALSLREWWCFPSSSFGRCCLPVLPLGGETPTVFSIRVVVPSLLCPFRVVVICSCLHLRGDAFTPLAVVLFFLLPLQEGAICTAQLDEVTEMDYISM